MKLWIASVRLPYRNSFTNHIKTNPFQDFAPGNLNAGAIASPLQKLLHSDRHCCTTLPVTQQQWFCRLQWVNPIRDTHHLRTSWETTIDVKPRLDWGFTNELNQHTHCNWVLADKGLIVHDKFRISAIARANAARLAPFRQTTHLALTARHHVTLQPQA